ncbi:UDP-glucose/GDP-mannose dehydrogenase family protein [Dehalobacter sp. DCM]|uniref:UDP-glucose dehydrogenase family protein n=1 Tax=Dehalobacter sp. DCM TaxID=2907827 RepID=UPI0030821D91|nr:UDP-glucose/GDP-mannose dehydrogenase family protein [Dehalobacter sp. DCM]
MNICIVGTGYVGLVTGVCFSHLGHKVICIDKDEQKITVLKGGKAPIYEPGIEELIRENVQSGRLSFDTDLETGVQASEVVFIAVGTPEKTDQTIDLTYVKEAASAIGKALNGYKIIVVKSTVPVGMTKLVRKIIADQNAASEPFSVASNPEFLREGTAVADFLNLERAVIGTDDIQAAETLHALYRDFAGNIVMTDPATAEMTKYAANAFLATKVTFINQIANICEKVGADVDQVALGMGMDKRIGSSFLQAGVGYGGSCFPKDTRALAKLAREVGYPFSILDEVIKANELQHHRVIEKLQEIFGDLGSRTIAILGATFKPNTDDTRSAPSRKVIETLLQHGASVKVFDPMAEAIVKDDFFRELPVSNDFYATLGGCDAAVILTEWVQIKKMNLAKVKDILRHPVLVDGRNIFSLQQIRGEGLIYCSIGRPNI